MYRILSRHCSPWSWFRDNLREIRGSEDKTGNLMSRLYHIYGLKQYQPFFGAASRMFSNDTFRVRMLNMYKNITPTNFNIYTEVKPKFHAEKKSKSANTRDLSFSETVPRQKGRRRMGQVEELNSSDATKAQEIKVEEEEQEYEVDLITLCKKYKPKTPITTSTTESIDLSKNIDSGDLDESSMKAGQTSRMDKYIENFMDAVDLNCKYFLFLRS